jgi:hypothetical protein
MRKSKYCQILIGPDYYCFDKSQSPFYNSEVLINCTEFFGLLITCTYVCTIAAIRFQSNKKTEYTISAGVNSYISIPEQDTYIPANCYLNDHEKLKFLLLPTAEKENYLQEQYKIKTKIFLKKAITKIKQERNRAERTIEVDAERVKQKFLSSRKKELKLYDKDIANLEKKLDL